MTDHPSDDDLRRDLRRIADWTDPLAVPAPEELVPGLVPIAARPSPARRLLAVAAGVLLVGGAVAFVVARGGDTTEAPDVEPAAPTTEQLIGVEWRIDSVAVDGADPVRPPVDADAVIRFSGTAVSGIACNHFGGDATVGDGTVTFGNEMASTAMGCGDPAIMAVELAVSQLVQGEGTWSITDGVLVLEANGVRLEGSEKANAFPTPDLEVLVASDGSSEAEWHFGYEQQPGAEYEAFLVWEGRSSPGVGFGSAGLAVDPTIAMDAMWVDHVEGGLFPFGTLPPGTVRAAFVAEDGTETELEVHALPTGRSVFGQPVAATGGTVQALGADGQVLETSRGLGTAAG
ncbi:MAG: META domain-containing protein [Acidimicrobiales bacterium]